MKFDFFEAPERRTFNYKPIYYDPEKEERKKKYGHVDGTNEKEMKSEDYVPGASLEGAFTGGKYTRSRGVTRAQSIIRIIAFLLIAVMLIYLAKFFSLF